MSSLIPKTQKFKAEQQKAREECRKCYEITLELVMAHNLLLRTSDKLVKAIEERLSFMQKTNTGRGFSLDEIAAIIIETCDETIKDMEHGIDILKLISKTTAQVVIILGAKPENEITVSRDMKISELANKAVERLTA